MTLFATLSTCSQNQTPSQPEDFMWQTMTANLCHVIYILLLLFIISCPYSCVSTPDKVKAVRVGRGRSLAADVTWRHHQKLRSDWLRPPRSVRPGPCLLMCHRLISCQCTAPLHSQSSSHGSDLAPWGFRIRWVKWCPLRCVWGWREGRDEGIVWSRRREAVMWC